MKNDSIQLIDALSSYIATDVMSLRRETIEFILENISDLKDLVVAAYDDETNKLSNSIPSSFEDYVANELNDKSKQNAIDKLYGYDRNEISRTEADSIMFKKPENIIDKYNNMPIKPVIKSVDLNNQNKKEFDEYNKPKTAYVIGLEMKF